MSVCTSRVRAASNDAPPGPVDDENSQQGCGGSGTPGFATATPGFKIFQTGYPECVTGDGHSGACG
jgi:hypothetical protein